MESKNWSNGSYLDCICIYATTKTNKEIISIKTRIVVASRQEIPLCSRRDVEGCWDVGKFSYLNLDGAEVGINLIIINMQFYACMPYIFKQIIDFLKF